VRLLESGLPGIRQLTVAYGILYGGIKNHFYALDAAKGTLLWSRDLPADQNINQPIALDGKLAYVVACSPLDDCYINAYTADKGSTAWRTAESRHRLEPLTIQNHIIYAISESNLNTAIPGVGVYAWNSMDGKQLWHYEAPKNMVIGSLSPIQVANHQVYIGLLSFEKTYVYTRLALDATTGVINWQSPKSPDDGNLLAVSGQTTYAGSGDIIFAYNTTDGRKLWQYTLPPISGDTDAIRILDIAAIPSSL
jgi:outer membrane protein assembly factor BamB